MLEESSLEGGVRDVVTVPGLGMVEYSWVEDTTLWLNDDDVEEKAVAGETARATLRIADWIFIVVVIVMLPTTNRDYYEWMLKGSRWCKFINQQLPAVASTPPIKKDLKAKKKPEADAPNYSRWMSKPFRDGCLKNNWESFSFHRPNTHVSHFFASTCHLGCKIHDNVVVTASTTKHLLQRNKLNSQQPPIIDAAAHKELLLHQLLIIL